MKLQKKEIFSIPNILGYIRILLIPLFTWRYLTAQSQADYYAAAGIVLLSGLTDLLDGFIARRFHMITELGKALDPIADKLTQAAIVFCLMFRVQWMVWLVLLFVVKECYMGVANLIVMRRGRKLNGAEWFGKVCTAVFYIVMFLMIALPGLGTAWKNTMMLICAAFMALSLVLYIPVFVRLYRGGKREE